MAEQQTNLKIIDYAGRTVDLDKFVQRAREKVNAWMDYQGLKGSQRTDFLNEINSRLLSIVEGTTNSSPGSTAIAVGGKPNKKSGKEGFDPKSNVDTFLNGIASVTTVGGTGSKSKSGKLPFSKRNTMATLISDAIFGEGNGFSEEQLNAWADAKDPNKEGEIRSTKGRFEFIDKLLGDYRLKLENGDYDISDEDKKDEIETIDSIRNNNLEQWELNKKAPWLSHLLFTDPKYYATEAARTAAENKAKEAKAQSYLNGSGENPYDKEKEKDKYNALETEKKKKADENFASQFDAYNIMTADNLLAGEHWLPRWNTVDRSVFSGWRSDDHNVGIDKLIDALYQVKNDYSDDGRGLDINTTGWNLEFGHDDYTGWGEGDTSMKDLFPEAYFKYAHDNDDMPDDVTSIGVEGFTKGRSNNAFKGKFLSDWLNYYMKSENGRNYRIEPNGVEYIFPDMVNWDKGTAYMVTEGENQINYLKQVNIAPLLPKIKQSNPNLYKELLTSYAKHKNYTLSNKEGGVLKAQFGAALDEINKGVREKIDTQNQHIAQVGQEQFDRELAGQSTRFTPLEMTRIGAAVADIGSAIAAWEPVYGTAASAALGLGSTAANLGADIFDKSVSSGQVLTNLGTNLVFDAVGLFGGVGKLGKIANTVVKLGPKLLAAYSLYNVGPEAYKSTEKLMSQGVSNMTTEDWKNIAYGMSAVAGTSRIGAAAYHNRRINNSRPKGTPAKEGDVLGQKVQVKDQDGKLKEIEFTTDELNQINSQANNSAATSKMREILKKNKGIEEANADKYELPDDVNIIPSGVKNLNIGGFRGKKLQGVNYTSEGTAATSVTRPEMIDWYARLQQQDLQNSNSWHARAAKSLEAFLPKGKKFATNNEIFAQGENVFKNPFAQGYLASQMGQQRQGQADELGLKIDDFNFKYTSNPTNKQLRSAADKKKFDEKGFLELRKSARLDLKKAKADLDGYNPTTVWEAKNETLLNQLTRRRDNQKKLHTDKTSEVTEIEGKIKDANEAYTKAEENLTKFTTVNKVNKKGKYGNQPEYDRLKSQFDKAKQELDDLKIIEATKKQEQAKLQAILDRVLKQLDKLNAIKTKFNQEQTLKQLYQFAYNNAKSTLSRLNGQNRIKRDLSKLSPEDRDKEITNILKAAKKKMPKEDYEIMEKTIKSWFPETYSPEAKALKARNALLTEIKNWRAAGRPTPNEAQRKAINTLSKEGLTVSKDLDYKGLVDNVKNDARFGAFIQDLADRGIGENQLKQILGNPQVLKEIRNIYGFKEGGQFIPKGDGGLIARLWSGIKRRITSLSDDEAPAVKDRRIKATKAQSSVATPSSVKSDNTLVKEDTQSQANSERDTRSQANSGKDTRSQAEADKPTTPAAPVNPVTLNTPLQGQLGNLQGNLGSLTGTLGSTGTTGDKYEPMTNEGYNGIDNIGSRWGSFGDVGLTGLELAKFAGSNWYNDLVRNKYKNLKPVHLINPLENYRIWSPKPLADQAEKVRTESAQLGDLAARGTNDLGKAFAYRLTAWDRGQKGALPYDLQYNADIKESVNTGLGVINRNNQAKVTRVNGNHQADVAKYNQDQMADAQYYNHLGTQLQQLLGTVLRGVAMSNAADYENEYNNFMATDPAVLKAKSDYQNAYNAYTAIKDSSDTEAINKAYAAYNAAANRYNDVLTQKSTMWLNTHRAPLGVPFARPRRTAGYIVPYSPAEYFDWGPKIAKKGGILEERGRMHRHHDKLFYQAQKLLMTESNKKLRAMANGYGYLLKLMMLSK